MVVVRSTDTVRMSPSLVRDQSGNDGRVVKEGGGAGFFGEKSENKGAGAAHAHKAVCFYC